VISSVSFISDENAAVETSRELFDEPRVSSVAIRKAVQLFALAMTTATLAACASSPIVSNKPASNTASRQASLQPNRKAHVVVGEKKHTPFAPNKDPTKTYGVASFYTEEQQTANGEQFDTHELTAAHRTLPFGTRVRVTNVATGSSVTVRVNDRGPFIEGRVIDLSLSAAETLGITEQGIAKVKLDIVQ